MPENIGAHELALFIINTAAGYPRRCAVARDVLACPHFPVAPRTAALEWAQIATRGARDYEREFGSPDASSFTAADILAAAAELADYYAAHVAETGRGA